MAGVNKVIILGRVGKDPEIRNLENGTSVATFSVATSETWKDKTTGEKKEHTDWHNIVLWRGLADIAAKYVHKGDQIYIEGKMRTRSWEKDGITRYTTEIIGDQMNLLGGKPSDRSEQSSQSSGQQESAPSGGSSSIDELPFSLDGIIPGLAY